MSVTDIWPPENRGDSIRYFAGKWDMDASYRLLLTFLSPSLPEVDEAVHHRLLELAAGAGVSLRGMSLVDEPDDQQLEIWFEASSEQQPNLWPLAESLRLPIAEALGLEEIDSYANCFPPILDPAPYFAFLDGDKTDRGERWREAEEWVARFDYDHGNTKIEPGVRELVITSHALGIPTHASCEGHLEQALSDEETGRAYGFVGMGFMPLDGQDVDLDALTARNLQALKLVEALLEEFYRERERPLEWGLRVESWPDNYFSIAPRLPNSWGGEMVEVEEDGWATTEIRFPEDYKPPILRDIPADELLAHRQQELQGFGSFLHALYFEGPSPDCSPELKRLLDERLGQPRPSVTALEDSVPTLSSAGESSPTAGY